MMNELDILDYFGEVLMRDVRDLTIQLCDEEINTEGGGQSVRKLRQKSPQLDEKEKELLHAVVPDVVDSVLHYMMFALEQHPEIEVRVGGENLYDISDGLAGELYTEDGWIMRFSKERYEEPSCS